MIIKNVGSQTIPPFGVCEIDDIRSDRGRLIFDVKRPTSDFITRLIINGPAQVKVSRFGKGRWPVGAPALCDNDGAGVYGAKSGEFVLNEYYGPFVLPDSSVDSADSDQIGVITAKADYVIRFGATSNISSGTFTANIHDSSDSSTGISATIHDKNGVIAAIGTGVDTLKGHARWFEDAERFEATGLIECP